MKRVLCFIMVLLVTVQSFASTFTGAIASYVQELFVVEDFRSLWKSYNTARTDPNGGYLLHYSLQFDSAEPALEFIASDRFGEISRNRPAWNIYWRKGDDQWSKLASGVMLSSDEFYINDASRTISQRFPNGALSTLQIKPDGTIEQKYYSPSEADSVFVDAKGLGKLVQPQIEKVPLAAYLHSPDIHWRPLDRQRGVEAQSLDDGDAELIAMARDLPWNDAVVLAQTLREKTDKADRSTESESQSGNVAAPPQEGTQHASLPVTVPAVINKPFINTGQKEISWSVILGGLGFVMAVAMLLIRFNKKYRK